MYFLTIVWNMQAQPGLHTYIQFLILTTAFKFILLFPILQVSYQRLRKFKQNPLVLHLEAVEQEFLPRPFWPKAPG